jgi:hypothetical protein
MSQGKGARAGSYEQASHREGGRHTEEGVPSRRFWLPRGYYEYYGIRPPEPAQGTAEGYRPRLNQGRFIPRGLLEYYGMVPRPASEPAEEAPPEALPQKTRSKMEGSFGQPLGDVRIHPDSDRAGGTTHAVTEGKDVHFAPGKFAPGTEEGDRLIGHELAHVVQQEGSAASVQAFEEGTRRGLLERDAHQAGERAARGEPAKVRLRATPGMVLRYESWEHADLGDAGGGGHMIRLPCGVELSYGEVMALAGDFYGSYETLLNAPRGEVLRLREILRRQRGQAKANGGQPTEEESAQNEHDFQQAALGRDGLHSTEGKNYVELAEDNNAHFSKDNVEEWRKGHRKALKLAATHKLEEALAIEAFHAHYLTDAFSAGHLVSGEVGRAVAADFIARHGADLEAILAHALAEDANIRDPSAATAIMLVMRSHLPSILLKIVHDALNRQGVTVSNKIGHRWAAYGDGHLATSREAQAMALEAVRRSREELEVTAQTGQVPTVFVADWLVPEQVEVTLPPTVPSLAGVRVEPQVIAMPLTDFSAASVIFRSLLEAVLLKKGPENPLYRLVRANAGFAGLKLEEWVRLLVHLAHRAGDGAFKLLDRAIEGTAK